MNDFTKEELCFIHDLIHDFLIGREHDLADQSYMKVKSMINNYCDHEHASSHPGDTVLVCNKCETILSHWNLRKAKV